MQINRERHEWEKISRHTITRAKEQNKKKHETKKERDKEKEKTTNRTKKRRMVNMVDIKRNK